MNLNKCDDDLDDADENSNGRMFAKVFHRCLVDIVGQVDIEWSISFSGETSHKSRLESGVTTGTTCSRSTDSATCVCVRYMCARESVSSLFSLSVVSSSLPHATLPFARFARSIQFTFSSGRKESTVDKGKERHEG